MTDEKQQQRKVDFELLKDRSRWKYRRKLAYISAILYYSFPYVFFGVMYMLPETQSIFKEFKSIIQSYLMFNTGIIVMYMGAATWQQVQDGRK